jgi:small-conductance mechanosensitive channel
LFVRVPNETLIKSEIVNLSRHPIRRIDIDLRLAYSEDLDKVGRILRELAHENPDILEEPEPVFWVDKLGDSAIHVRFLVWASNRHGFYDVRSRMLELVAHALQEHRISVGFQRVEVEGNDSPATVAAIEAVVARPGNEQR